MQNMCRHVLKMKAPGAYKGLLCSLIQRTVCFALQLNGYFLTIIERAFPYTQFPSHDSGLFGPNPWKILAPPSNYL